VKFFTSKKTVFIGKKSDSFLTGKLQILQVTSRAARNKTFYRQHCAQRKSAGI